MSDTQDKVLEIFDREIARLNTISESGGLDTEGIKQLTQLTTALKNYQSTELDEDSEEDLSKYTLDELIDLAKET